MHQKELHQLQTDLELSQEEAAALKEVNLKLSQEVHHFKCKLWKERREVSTLEHDLRQAKLGLRRQNNELQYQEMELWKWIKLAQSLSLKIPAKCGQESFSLSNKESHEQDALPTSESADNCELEKMEITRAAEMSGKSDGGKICADSNRIHPA